MITWVVTYATCIYLLPLAMLIVVAVVVVTAIAIDNCQMTEKNTADK